MFKNFYKRFNILDEVLFKEMYKQLKLDEKIQIEWLNKDTLRIFLYYNVKQMILYLKIKELNMEYYKNMLNHMNPMKVIINKIN